MKNIKYIVFITVLMFSMSGLLEVNASCYSCEDDCSSNRIQNNRRIPPQRHPLPPHRLQMEIGRNYRIPPKQRPSVRQPLPLRSSVMFR